ncbi:hypothetical protein HHI36_012417 [Cryptolaemus montrouzieri]|uniref:Uncharacterized protein n=1 Tax=Cryptolaemus montrouzieri TaxID=559131 RepID=A0ABD2NE64_9CUCU
MDSDDDTKERRTKGKKTSYLSYLDTLGSDRALKKKIKDKSEDDEYVADDVDEENDREKDKESEEDSKANSKTKRSDSEDEAPLVVKKY